MIAPESHGKKNPMDLPFINFECNYAFYASLHELWILRYAQ